jgi:AAA+ ATPase superfamily predicted ATPase
MKELQIKPLSMALGYRKKPIIFWNKKQNLYSFEEFNKEIKSFFNEYENHHKFYLECEFGVDDTIKSYVLEFTRNKTETVENALLNHAFTELEAAIKRFKKKYFVK